MKQNKSNTKNRASIWVVLMGCIGFGLLPIGASAVPITGEIGFGGLFNHNGTTDLSDATGISIGFSTVIAGTGDFAPATGMPATFMPLDFANPAGLLWSAGMFSFNLANLSIDLQTATALNLSGMGTLMGTGFDATPGTWTFSGDQLGIFATFSSITAADDPVGVPEPGTLALLAFGLLGFAVSRRKS